MPQGMDEQRRYEDLLDLITELRRDAQAYQQRADKERRAHIEELRTMRIELTNQMLTYWQGTAAALRQLSDWRVDDETLARSERTAERQKRDASDQRRDRRERTIIGLLTVLALAALIYVALMIGAQWL